MGAHFKLAPEYRAAIENQIESLIALLDGWDGDCDLEDDDPAGDTLDEHGEGVGEYGRGLLPDRPIYVIDQRSGPINYRDADLAHHAREAGIARTASGGWHRP